jgi:hypothetical protein
LIADCGVSSAESCVLNVKGYLRSAEWCTRSAVS